VPSGAVSSQSGRVVSSPFQTGFKPTLGNSATAAAKPITSDNPTEKKRDCMGGVNLLKFPKSINWQRAYVRICCHYPFYLPWL
jgi:hypothetical protein